MADTFDVKVLCHKHATELGKISRDASGRLIAGKDFTVHLAQYVGKCPLCHPVTPPPIVVPPPVPPPGPTDVLAAIRAATSGDTITVPAGTYPGTVIVPNGVNVIGPGSAGAWLKGRVDFGSGSRIVGLKIGDIGAAAVSHVEGAANTSLENCRFRGGGGATYTSVVDLGSPRSCRGITFKGCEVERNLASDPTFSGGYNDVTIWVGHGHMVDDITFDTCHIGVSNGVAAGSPRFTVEVYTNNDAQTLRGFTGITFRDSTLYGADAETLDLSDQDHARADNILVEGCTIHGGGVSKVKWGNGLNLECPTGVTIRNNTFTRSWGPALQMTPRSDPFTAAKAVITGNTFDFTQGIQATNGDAPIVLWGDGNTFTGNTVKGHTWSSSLFWLRACHANVITGNTLHSASRIFSELDGSSGNTLTPNAIVA
jgi:hypothetical protein